MNCLLRGRPVHPSCQCAASAGPSSSARVPLGFATRRSRATRISGEAPFHGEARGRLVRSAGASREVRRTETVEEQMERRLRESEQVESRVVSIDDEEEFVQQLEEAGKDLVVVEFQSERVCETGLFEPEPELQWKLDAEKEAAARMARCADVKHVIQRTARECTDVRFLSVETDGSPDREALLQRLGVTVLPTLQFYREGKLLWEHKGVAQMGANVGEGLMYYGDRAGSGGVQPSTLVAEVTSRASLDAFLNANPDPKVLNVLQVALTNAGPCIKVFPAVVALARSFQGYASFARLIGDTNGETRELLKDFNIVEVPTFLFFRGGKEVGRHVGSSRGDLIGQILTQQAAQGLSPPPPPVTARKSRSRASMRDAKLRRG
ncbi:hypothetical protein HYH03_018681 [Edaphochlamys debaryana]|uniref:Thioredoxin domain-containing protein n=1 Tax=Edaphochlamys debaryana TaxID=47281 RepID=A0A835XFI9_9CHLO|nr:hypothetical protein HYH03_018681 [Edaphochlamys debaryana]|eukprot:KAG2482385.1 hypothetical protein HYH03_018681 [Edaphochlamys debaryana]